MRILYLHQHFVTREGTSGGRSHEFGRILVKKGHSVTLITGAYDHSGLKWKPGGRQARFDVDGMDVRGVPVAYSQRMSMLQRIIAFVRFIFGACRESCRVRDVDVVFATSTPLTIAVPGLWAAWWHKCPFVFEVRDLWPAAPIELGVLKNPLLICLARRLERSACRRATHVIALSPGMKQGLLESGVPTEKVSVIPNSSDVELFRVSPDVGRRYREGLGRLSDRPWVVYAGAFGRVNGVEWAVRLAGEVAQLAPDVAFLFWGSGSEKEKARMLAADMGLVDRTVFFRDPVPRRELSEILSAATVLSSFCLDLPVLRTNSANKFFDAFAAGRPVVINYGGWQAELLEAEGAGLVLDSEDLQGSARRLVAALGDAEWIERAGAASRRLGDTVFNRGRLADALEQVLVKAVGKPAAASKVSREPTGEQAGT